MWPFNKKKPDVPPDSKDEQKPIWIVMAESCVTSAKKAYGVDLDYSLESLGALENILQQMHEEHKATPISEQGMQARTISLGSYLGEVLRRASGSGTWARDSALGENTFPLIFANDQQLFPVGWVHKRIVNGAEDNIVFKAKVMLSTLRGEGPFAKGQNESHL